MQGPLRTKRLALAAGALAWLAVAPATAQQVVIKMATLVPEGSSWHLILKEMADRWKTVSGGRVVVRLYAGGVAGDDADVVRKIRLGTLNAGVLTDVGLEEIDRSVLALSVPMMYSSYEEVDHVLDRMRPGLEAKLAAKGFVTLAWLDGGWSHIFAQKPVATPDDLKPLKLFTPSGDPQAVEIYKAAGFNPVPLPTTELSTALQTGLVTALQVPPQVAVITQYYTHAKYMTDLKWLLLLGATVIDKATWEKIPADLRPALLEAAHEAGSRLRADVRQGGDRDVEAMKKRGLVVVPVDARAMDLWRKAAEGAYPRIRGPVVPADAFDEALRDRDELRKHPAAAPHGR
ncbi:MAG TPA: TRAP transporter substrate-binding protein DctP [Thermoanaerobaculia bacterium]|jgi:TRAP-type C4-dicarboxylate transport system substrate-binding protein|nr:TRAP transporter substrate-binding protein DctP [Thermoanaerobaculia bacterium]